MRVFCINNFQSINSQPLTASRSINNVTDSRHNNLVLKGQLAQDTVNFNGKIPSIVAPTMEDLIKRTKAVDVLRYNVLRLAKFDLPCPVCGRIMLDVEKFNDFEQKVLSTTNPDEILSYIDELKKYLHPVERKIFLMMKEERNFHSDYSLHDILKSKLPVSERKIVQTQAKIFSEIGILSRNLSIDNRTQLQALLNETFARIFDPRETSRFSRRIFINKLKNIFVPETVRQNFRVNLNDNWIYTPLQDIIIEKAVELPIARNNIDAFIVKYAKRDYKGANPDQKIALRMLSNSLATVEHIKAQFRNGTTEPKNLAVECAADNNGHGSDYIIEQISENPAMLTNYPRYMARLCKIHKMGKVEKSYITQQNKTFCSESYGLLNAKLDLLKPTKKGKKYKYMTANEGLTPTKNERRAARKMKLKSKKHNKNNGL